MNIKQPYSEEAEIAVLGAMILDNDCIEDIADALAPDAFYLEKHRTIYNAILNLYHKQQPVDLVTLTEVLRQNGKIENVGSIPYLIGLAENVPTGAFYRDYTRVVHEHQVRRKVIAQSLQNIQDARDVPEISTLVDKIEQRSYEVSRAYRGTDSFYTAPEFLQDALDYIKEQRETTELPGTSTGLNDLNEWTGGGLKRGTLNIVGARPSMGKTALLMTMAYAAGKTGTVLFFEPEMSARELGIRLLAYRQKILSDKLQQPRKLSDIDMKNLGDGVKALSTHGIQVDDSQSINVMDIRSRARQKAMRHDDINLIIVDYLQILEHDANNAMREFGEISRKLKQLARELDVPVVLASQLNRGVESRPNKRPNSADLRESGRIEENADLILMIYRDFFYEPTANPNEAELIITKNRHGRTGTANVAWLPDYLTFADSTHGKF